MSEKNITGQQLRMARVSLKWRVDDLSKKSEVTWARIQTYERSNDFLPNDEKTRKIINIFNANNIEFVNDDDKYQPYIKIKK